MPDRDLEDLMTRPGASEDTKILLRALREMRNSFVRDSDKKHDENTRRLDTVSLRLDDLAKGFPDGDAVGHRRFHEAEIAAANERRRMYAEIRLKFVTASMWGLVIFLGGLLIKYAKEFFTP